MRYWKQSLCMAALAAVCCLTCGCGEADTGEASPTEHTEEVVIPAMFRMDGETGVQANKELVDAFNEEYAGRYRVEVEWYIGDEAGYRDRVKLLNAIDRLPAVFTDVGVLPDFYRLLIENDRLVNIIPYLEADEEWRSWVSDAVIDACSEEEGVMYLIPLNTPEYMTGIYYNKGIFTEAGIEHFPKTWEEFFRACDAIEAQGYIPLALHTTGTAWTTMLFSTAYLGRCQEGRDFMSIQYPQNYDTVEFRDMLSVMKRFFAYAPEEYADGDYVDAYDDFVNGRVAMFPNGQWMIDDLYNESIVNPEFSAQLGFATFPENTAVGSPQGSAWAIAGSFSEEVIEGAAAFMKFRTRQERRNFSEEAADGPGMPLYAEYYEQVQQAEIVVPNYQMKWNSLIQEEVFLIELPRFLRDEISMDDFLDSMNEAVRRFNYERGFEDGKEE